MRIVENTSPVFTERHLDHIERYREAYGPEFFTSDMVAEERKRVREGQASRRIGWNGRCFEVYDEAERHIGDVVLVLNNMGDFGGQMEQRYELDLAIFHEHAGQGNGRKAMEAFLAYYKEHFGQPLEVIIMNGNPQREQVLHLFESLGFRYEEDLGAAGRVYLLR